MSEGIGLRRGQGGEDLLLVALDALRARHDRDHLRKAFEPAQPERGEAAVEAHIGDALRGHAAADEAGGVDLGLQRRIERQIDPERHVDRVDDDAHPPAGTGHPHDLRQHQFGIALLEHGRGQGDIDRAICQRQRLGAAFAEIDMVEQPFAPGQCPCLAQQIGAHVATDQTVCAAGSPRQLAHDHARAAADFEHPVARHDRQRVEQCADDRHVAGAAALLEAGDAAEQRAAEGDRAVARRQRWDQRLPLPRRQIERQQHQRRPGAAHAIGDAGDLAFLLRQGGGRPDPGQIRAREEFLHRRADAVAALGGDVRPGMPGVIIQHHRGGLRQLEQPRLDPAGARTAVAGHHQQPPGQRRHGARVQHRGAQQRQGRNALRMPGHEALQIRRAAPGKMRGRHLKIIEQLTETCFDRAVFRGV